MEWNRVAKGVQNDLRSHDQLGIAGYALDGLVPVYRLRQKLGDDRFE